MALTDSCDIYFAIHDAGINRVVRHVFRQRPSLVNIGTAGFVQQPERLCERIDAHPVVLLRGNPLVREVPGLPIALTAYSLEYCFQIRQPELDVHPGDVIAFPPEIVSPLGEQLLGLHVGACFGFGCPSDDLLDKLPWLVPQPPINRTFVDRPPRGGGVIPAGGLLCTCVDLFATLGADFVGPLGAQRVAARLGDLEIVDLGPTSLEDSIECYAKLVIRLGLFPLLLQPSTPAIWLTKATELFSVVVEPSPNSPALPNNPALEDNQLKLFIDIAFGSGEPQGPGGGGGGGGSTTPVDPGVVRPRTRTGTFDATVAVGEEVVQSLFTAVRDGFSISGSNSGDFGPFTASYAAEVHLENGTIDFRPDGSIALEELDVAFDILQFCLGIDLPDLGCFGGFCIIGIPFDGCLVRAPRICLFQDDPDIELCIDIGPFLRLELSAALRPLVKYAVNPARTPGMNDWDAVEAGHPNHWQIFVDPVSIDIDLFDVADIVGNLLEDALDAALDTFLGPLPGWAKTLIKAILGPVIDVVVAILDLGDDIEEWISEKLGVSLGLFDFILTAVGDYLSKDKPLIQPEDPLTVMAGEPGLMPVLVPIEFLGIRLDTNEMVLEVDLGG